MEQKCRGWEGTKCLTCCPFDSNQMMFLLVPRLPGIHLMAPFTILTPSCYCYLLQIFNNCSVQFSSVAQLYPTPCNPVNRSTPGLPVHHQLTEFTQTHAHRVGDAIQPSHPPPFPSPSAFNLSQHQGLFQ